MSMCISVYVYIYVTVNMYICMYVFSVRESGHTCVMQVKRAFKSQASHTSPQTTTSTPSHATHTKNHTRNIHKQSSTSDSESDPANRLPEEGTTHRHSPHWSKPSGCRTRSLRLSQGRRSAYATYIVSYHLPACPGAGSRAGA
jgi:hypothetical protein